MNKRKSISKKIRFEVFKRDSFTCQYCGSKSPDVTLVIDHIMPVASGGTNTILNLVTSCFSCNSGKGKRSLNDDAVVSRKREQLAQLQERREQMKMMLDWHNEIQEQHETSISWVNDKLKSISGYGANESGKAEISKLVRQFGLLVVLRGVEMSFERNLCRDSSDKPTSDSWECAFKNIGGSCVYIKAITDDPVMADAYSLRSLLRYNVKMKWAEPQKALHLIREALRIGITKNDLAVLCSTDAKGMEFFQWAKYIQLIMDGEANNG
jgi:hypothetical protein